MDNSERKGDADSNTKQNQESNIVSPSTIERTKVQPHQTQGAPANKNNRTSIDLSLPTPHQPPITVVENVLIVGLAVEVDGGMDGGCQGKLTWGVSGEAH